MAKQPRSGSGERFARLVRTLGNKPGIYDPEALAAKIGRAKVGKQKFQKLARIGRRRAAREA